MKRREIGQREGKQTKKKETNFLVFCLFDGRTDGELKKNVFLLRR